MDAMDKFMARAMELALQNVKEGGQPFGAVLVKDGVIVAEGVNELHRAYDVSGHAELLAVRRAQAKLQTHDLSGHVMYASGEPCPMCLAAMYFAGVSEVVYGASVDEAAEAGLGLSRTIYDDLRKPRGERRLPLRHMPLPKDERHPFHVWKNRQ